MNFLNKIATFIDIQETHKKKGVFICEPVLCIGQAEYHSLADMIISSQVRVPSRVSAIPVKIDKNSCD
eukprot:g41723.t1